MTQMHNIVVRLRNAMVRLRNIVVRLRNAMVRLRNIVVRLHNSSRVAGAGAIMGSRRGRS
jgi:hypothetical protein